VLPAPPLPRTAERAPHPWWPLPLDYLPDQNHLQEEMRAAGVGVRGKGRLHAVRCGTYAAAVGVGVPRCEGVGFFRFPFSGAFRPYCRLVSRFPPKSIRKLYTSRLILVIRMLSNVRHAGTGLRGPPQRPALLQHVSHVRAPRLTVHSTASTSGGSGGGPNARDMVKEVSDVGRNPPLKGK
jgi:hypothetical protein